MHSASAFYLKTGLQQTYWRANSDGLWVCVREDVANCFSSRLINEIWKFAAPSLATDASMVRERCWLLEGLTNRAANREQVWLLHSWCNNRQTHLCDKKSKWSHQMFSAGGHGRLSMRLVKFHCSQYLCQPLSVFLCHTRIPSWW